ncbi:chemotaxis protein CheW [Halorhabdus sp. CBA1104]|uniref:chemotaxis protein CheW n=1 Tax=Halorhabdus sp. CBA1104 TaxID=1380432 RepID=UPI0012B23E4E|nr:chemotaxis protein CheW [Halorhabdus sp. CBA1104]QGN07531.1 chemotaxis protein CheW [Halorhabdus sp. CBA1104]
MSDEDDERMDRARRIRNLREGRRGGDEPTDESPDTDEDRDEPSESAGSDGQDDAHADGEDATNAGDDEGARSEPGDGEESAGSGTETPGTDEKPDTGRSMAEDRGEGVTAGTDPAKESRAGPESDEEAVSAAQAAAQAASEFEGDGAVSMDVEEAVGEAASGEASTDEAGAPAGTTVTDADVVEQHEEETRVLEFRLGEELYCLDITYVEEIVREEAITRVPNTPAYVSGVVDLRGQITTILDPKTAVDIAGESDDRLILVFDADTFDDHGYIGWLVDEVNQVTPITESEVKESPIDEPYINGVIERDDKFVIWTSPEMALDVGADD